MRALLTVLAATLLSGCLGVPAGVVPVQNFELERYLGQWYEIARLDHSFERGLDQVSAQYSLRADGGVSVLNRGFAGAKQEWSEARGKAFFVGPADEGYLKVSFFGPFYGSYVIFELDAPPGDAPYQYAFIAGPDTSYLWFLARTPEVDAALLEQFVERAASLGFDTASLIFPAPAITPQD